MVRRILAGSIGFDLTPLSSAKYGGLHLGHRVVRGTFGSTGFDRWCLTFAGESQASPQQIVTHRPPPHDLLWLRHTWSL